MSTPGSAATANVQAGTLALSLAPVRAHDEEQLAADLALLLRSGLHLSEALRALVEREAGGMRRELPALVQALQQGHRLSAALAAAGGFSPGLLACVRASEATGDLGESLAQFAQHAKRLREWRGKLVSASVYPLMLVLVATLVVMFLLMFVVPRFALVLDGAAQDMPLASRLLVAAGLALHQVQWPLVACLVAGLAGAGLWVWRGVSRQRLGPWLIDRLEGAPGLGRYVRAYGLAQLARSAGMLVRSGVPALKALAMCRDLLPARDGQRLDAALVQATQGQPLARSLQASGLFDALSARVLMVAQQTGQLATALDRVADLHDDTLGKALERMSRLVEPLLMLGIGGVVGGIVVLMYLPIFQLAASIR